ncbi:hypothetical protein KC950_02880 [Candidatus Saccharibacteria bacterium]|nr:hypothetical protein [Candidatus Saccharibacteria bacterium]
MSKNLDNVDFEHKNSTDMFHYSCGAPASKVVFRHPGSADPGNNYFAIKVDDNRFTVQAPEGESALSILPNDLAQNIVARWFKHGLIDPIPSNNTSNEGYICTAK